MSTTGTTATASARAGRRTDGPLWAAAAALIVLLAARLGGDTLPAPATAQAGLVNQVGELVVITAATGSGEDILTVLDQRTGTLLVYRANPRRALELMQVAPVTELFDQARAAGPSNRR